MLRRGREGCEGVQERRIWDSKEGDGGVSASVVGCWEHPLALNVLQQSPRRENNIGWFINLIIVPCQTPVSVFTPLLIFPFPPIPHRLSVQQRAEAWGKKVTLTLNKQYVQTLAHT